MTAEIDPLMWQLFAGLHRLMLRLAGRVPDGLLSGFRETLCTPDVMYLPDRVTEAVMRLDGVTLTGSDVSRLRDVPELLALNMFGMGRQPEALDRIPVSETVPATGHRFAPGPDGAADAALIAGLSGTPAVIEARRTWRSGPDAPPGTGRWVYLVVVEPGAEAWTVASQTQAFLAGRGERAPQVEVYWNGDVLTPYQRAARDGSAPLWSRPAAVRDPVHPGCPADVRRVVAAARDTDLSALHRLVDWRLSAAGAMARGLSQGARPQDVEIGLAEMDEAMRTPEPVVQLLLVVAWWLATAREIRPAGPEERDDALRALRVEEVPAGWPERQALRFEECRRRAAALEEVCVALGPAGTLPFARAAGTGQVVLVMDALD